MHDAAGWDPSSGGWWTSMSDGIGSTTRLAGWWSNALTWSDVGVADLADAGDRGTQGHFTYKSDLVGRAGDGTWWAAVSNGDGTFHDVALTRWDETAGWRDVRFLDLNGDGTTDIVGRTSTGRWWAALSQGGLTYQNVALARWDESAGWHDVLVTKNFFGDGRDTLLARTSDGVWWALRAGGTTSQMLGSWDESAGWKDVLAGDFDPGTPGSEVVGRTAGGAWWISSWNGTALSSRPFGAWVESAGWQDVSVADSRTGWDAIVGRTAADQWWASQAPKLQISGQTLTNVAFGQWVPDAGWRDVQTVHVLREPVVATSSGNLLTVDIYANRLGSAAYVTGGGSSVQISYYVAGSSTPRVFAFPAPTHAGAFFPILVRFNGNVSSDLFENDSTWTSVAHGNAGDDAFYVRNGVMDQVFDGDGLDQLVTSDAVDTFQQDG